MEWLYETYPEYEKYDAWRRQQPEGVDTSAARYLEKDWWTAFTEARREVPGLTHYDFFHFREAQRENPDIELREFIEELRRVREENWPEIQYIQ